ncbi:MAG: wax ester/triacylglycerol synthase domain-containing protein, partial [Acidimicrobiia bacterium]
MDKDDPYLRDTDAFSWYMESDPLLRSTVASVVVLDGQPDLDRLLERADRASRITPGFRHKVVQAPMRLANPRWAIDEDFELGFHTRRIAAPTPGSLTDVFDYACQTAMAGFDRERALWEFTLVEGLAGGRAALVLKLHHVLTDGIGGMEMAKNLFDLEREPRDLGPMPPVPSGERLSAAELTRDALGHNAGRAADFARGLLPAAGRSVAHALRHPSRALKEGVEAVGSIARTVRPVNETLSPVMQERRLAWRYDALVLPLNALRDSAHTAGLTVNDAFLAALSSGLQHYHEQHGAAVEELRLTMPISIRKPEDPVGGNRITLMRFRIPVGLRDPDARMRRIHELCMTARNEPAVAYTNAIAGALNVLPRAYVGGMLKHVDFLASNVPGISVPVYLAGARVAEWYAFGPTIGAALNATLVSYDGTCYVGVNVDTGAVPDGAVMLE